MSASGGGVHSAWCSTSCEGESKGVDEVVDDEDDDAIVAHRVCAKGSGMKVGVVGVEVCGDGNGVDGDADKVPAAAFWLSMSADDEKDLVSVIGAIAGAVAGVVGGGGVGFVVCWHRMIKPTVCPREFLIAVSFSFPQYLGAVKNDTVKAVVKVCG